MKNINKHIKNMGIQTILVFALILGVINGCNKEPLEKPSNLTTLIELAQVNKPDSLEEYGDMRLIQLDTNIVDNYWCLAVYDPYLEFETPQYVLPIENFIHGARPGGDLRGARDTTNGVEYYAYWFDAFYDGEFRNFIIYTLKSNPTQNFVYNRIVGVLDTPTKIAGETIVQVQGGTYLNGFGTIGLFGNQNVPNIGVWDINPFIDNEGKLYNAARWDLQIEAIYNSDTLHFRRYSYVRIGESSDPIFFEGVGFLNAWDPNLVTLGGNPTISISLAEFSPITINYQGNDIEFFLSSTDMNGFEIGSSITNTGTCSVYCQGIFNGQLVEIPISDFSQITFISNRGEGVIYNAY